MVLDVIDDERAQRHRVQTLPTNIVQCEPSAVALPMPRPLNSGRTSKYSKKHRVIRVVIGGETNSSPSANGLVLRQLRIVDYLDQQILHTPSQRH